MAEEENTGAIEERRTAIQRAKLLKTLIGLSEVSIIINTFIKAFKKNSVQKGDGNWYLHGNFNLGGTAVSYTH